MTLRLRLCRGLFCALLCAGPFRLFCGGTLAACVSFFAALFALLLFAADLRILSGRLHAFRRYETMPCRADQIIAARLAKRFADDGEILLALELQQSALHRLVLRRTRDVDRLACARVGAGVEHAGGKRAGSRIEVLHLLGLMADVAQVFRQLDCSLQIAARMAGNEIGHEILFLAQLFVDALVLFAEGVIDVSARLAHDGEYLRADMLRRNLELTADVVLAKLLEERIGLVRHDIVIAKTAANEDLLDLGQCANLTQQIDVIRVIDLKVRTGLGEQALACGAGAVFHLLFAARMPEIGRRAADVVDISLKAGHLRDGLCFFEHGFVAAGGNDALCCSSSKTKACNFFR